MKTIKYNKSQIMKNAHYLKREMNYSTFSQALKHSWLVAKNEARENEANVQRNAVYAQWRAEGEAKRETKRIAEHTAFLASGLSSKAWAMRDYYGNGRYCGD